MAGVSDMGRTLRLTGGNINYFRYSAPPGSGDVVNVAPSLDQRWPQVFGGVSLKREAPLQPQTACCRLSNMRSVMLAKKSSIKSTLIEEPVPAGTGRGDLPKAALSM